MLRQKLTALCRSLEMALVDLFAVKEIAPRNPQETQATQLRELGPCDSHPGCTVGSGDSQFFPCPTVLQGRGSLVLLAEALGRSRALGALGHFLCQGPGLASWPWEEME